MLTSKKQFLVLIVIALSVGLTSGVIGAVSSQNYLDRYAASLELYGDRFMKLSEQKPRALPGTYEEAVSKTRETVSPSVARFYKGNAEAYLPGAESSLGVVVTSDGWILTGFETIEGDAPLRVFIGQDAYTVIDYVADPMTGTAMVRVAGSGLTVIAFGASDAVESGDLAFAAVGQTGILPTAIVDADNWIAKSAINSSEQFTSAFLLADAAPLFGTAVVNTLGELIAIDATPLHQILPFVKSVIRSGQNTRPTLGVMVMDLSRAAVGETISRGFDRGAYVSAVTNGSAAAAGGVKKGDIIIDLNGAVLSSRATLAEFLTAYNPGDRVTLSIDRAGEEMEITVELGSK